MKAERTHFEKLQVYKLAERLCDEIWTVAKGWDYFSRDTVGRQLVRFIRNARGSLYETRHWLRRAHQRGLLGRDVVAKIRPTIDELSLKLSAYLRSMSELAAKGLETTSQEPERRGRAKNEELRTKN